jgi:hypothetical protein
MLFSTWAIQQNPLEKRYIALIVHHLHVLGEAIQHIAKTNLPVLD